MRYAICYVSTATKKFAKEEIDDLLKVSKEKNNEKDIRGFLLYSEGNFFQIMEGQKNTVLDLYTKIQKDPRHETIIQILGKEIPQGAFDGFETDVVTDNNKYDPEIMEDYLFHIKGLDDQTQAVVERMLEVFIETRK